MAIIFCLPIGIWAVPSVNGGRMHRLPNDNTDAKMIADLIEGLNSTA
jgi:hypothetical protein